MLDIGIPKGENLYKKIERLFEEARIGMERKEKSLRVEFPKSTYLGGGFLLKTRRVPILVKSWDLDVGIVGEDVLAECDRSRIIVLKELLCERLGLKTTRVVLFGRQDDAITRIEDIPPGQRIICEYPKITRKFFKGKVDVRIEESPGGCEAEVLNRYRFGVAVVETGNTLRANGLREIRTIFRSKPVLVANNNVLLNSFKRQRAEGLVAELEKVLI